MGTFFMSFELVSKLRDKTDIESQTPTYAKLVSGEFLALYELEFLVNMLSLVLNHKQR